MKALSLIQPYATLIMLGYKTNETRSWDTKHDGPLAIAASAGKPAWARQVCQEDMHIRQILSKHGLTFDTLPRGAVLGVADLVGTKPIAGPNTYLKNQEPHMFCHPEQLSPVERACGDYSCRENGVPKRFAWALRNVVVFPEPIPCKGALSLWQVPLEVEELFPLSSASVHAPSSIQVETKPVMKIRTYRFKHGVLHLEKAATVSMPDEEVAEQYADQGPLLEAWDDEMGEKEFFDLEDLRDL